MTVISRPVPNPTRARRAPLLAAAAVGFAAVGVGAAVTVLADDPPPTVVPTSAAVAPAPALPNHQMTVAEEVALLQGTAMTVPTIVHLCLDQTPC